MCLMTQAMIPYLCNMDSCYIGSFYKREDVSQANTWCGMMVAQGNSKVQEHGTLSLFT